MSTLTPGTFSPRFILFDLDGTLVDTAPDLAYCVDHMLEALGRPPCGEARVREWIGNGAERLVKRALTGEMQAEPEPDLQARAFAKFNAFYHVHTADDSRPYPGALETLAALHGGRPLGCITNKPRVFTDRLIEALGFKSYLDILICGDDLPRKKPDPLPLVHAAERLGFAPHHGLMVGDSRSDIRAAQAAGMPVVAVRGGYNHGEEVSDYHPDRVIETLAELPDLLTQPTPLSTTRP